MAVEEKLSKIYYGVDESVIKYIYLNFFLINVIQEFWVSKKNPKKLRDDLSEH